MRKQSLFRLFGGDYLPGLVAILSIGFLSLLIAYLQKPPAVETDDSLATVFSTARAMKHVEAIAREPHPSGSAQIARVREYILGELSGLGLDTQVQASGKGVQNIIARLKGADNSKALLLLAHYDTVAASPGASDDSSSVAAILETLRALKSDSLPKNDVIALITDGEEAGLLGARAFVLGHPWAKEVGLVLNFEARGTRGPTLMFETSQGNGWLVSQYGKSSSSPFATSLMYEIYKTLPNDTDFTVFKDAGFAGLNFAFIDGYANYHTRFDSLENIDRRSLQHQGANALSLTRHFGNLDLSQVKSGDAVYFDLFGIVLINYSVRWVVPLTLLLSFMFAAVIVLGIKRKRLTVQGASVGFFALLASMVAAALTATLAWAIIRAAASLNPRNSGPGLLTLSLVCVAIATSTAVYAWLCKKLKLLEAVVGALAWWVLLLITTTFLLPTASYLLAWPLLFSLGGLLYRLTQKHQELSLAKSLAVLYACAIPTLLLIVPVLCLMFIALTLSWAGPIMLLASLLLGPFIPQIVSLSRSGEAAARETANYPRDKSVASSAG